MMKFGRQVKILLGAQKDIIMDIRQLDARCSQHRDHREDVSYAQWDLWLYWILYWCDEGGINNMDRLDVWTAKSYFSC